MFRTNSGYLLPFDGSYTALALCTSVASLPYDQGLLSAASFYFTPGPQTSYHGFSCRCCGLRRKSKRFPVSKYLQPLASRQKIVSEIYRCSCFRANGTTSLISKACVRKLCCKTEFNLRVLQKDLLIFLTVGQN